MLDSRDIADVKVVETLRKVEHLGHEKFVNFVEDGLNLRKTTPFHPIPRNKLPRFDSHPEKTISQDKQQIICY